MAKSQRATASRDKKELPKLADINPIKLKFAQEYLKNGGNAGKAYKSIRPHVTDKTAYNEGHLAMKRQDTREAFVALLDHYGVTDDKTTIRLRHMLESTDPWTCNEAIKHLRAIKGLDAPKHSHKVIDKRSVSVQLKAEDATKLLDDIISRTK